MIQTIDQVIDELETIVAICKKENSPLGYFAVLYLEVTRNVKIGIDNKQFEDTYRMEKLDVLFANRYIDAFNNFRSDKPITESWLKAFEQSTSPLLIAQHLFLGINAHINLDLGIAAAETMANKDLSEIEDDFNDINNLLGDMLDDFQNRLNKVSPLFKWIDRLAGNKEEMLVMFSIKLARKGAWKFAQEYHASDEKATLLNGRDQKIQNIALLLTSFKSKFLKRLIKFIRFFESKDPNKVMAILEQKKAS